MLPYRIAFFMYDFGSSVRRSQNFEVSYVFRLFDFWIFFPFSFLFAAVIDLIYWACLQLKSFLESVIEAANFYMEQPGVVAGNFALSFSLIFFSIFVHISGSIRPITLIWASLERSFPPAEVEYRWWQFWSKVMMSEVEEWPLGLSQPVRGGTGVNGLRTFTLIVFGHPYCAHKFTCHIMHWCAYWYGRWPLLWLCLDLTILDVRWPLFFLWQIIIDYKFEFFVNCTMESHYF